jgi:type I restriction enzyme R subunit
MTSKKDLSERDICTQFIVPALKKAGWDLQRQVREEVSFTDGRIYVKGTSSARGSRKRADFILYYKPNIPIAVIEAKDNTHFVGAGMQQALGYASTLDIPVAFSSNGDGFVEHDRTASSGTVERNLHLMNSPLQKNSGSDTRFTRGSIHPSKNRSPRLITSMTARAVPLATISR